MAHGDPPFPNYPYHPNALPRQPQYSVTMVPVGCICPPGANKECERPDCPRKPLRSAAGMVGGVTP